MISYLIKRILWVIPTLFGVSLLVFSMLHLTPGEPALAILGEHATAESIEKFNKEMGLDKPLNEQYINFISKAIKGDFGVSLKSKQPVLVEFKERFFATAELAIVAMFFAIIFGVIMGVISAVYRYSKFDYLSTFISLTGVSMPVFWLGLMLIYLFSIYLELLPVSGRLGYEFWVDEITGFYLIDTLLNKDYPAFFDAFKHILMPAFALGTIPMAIIARMSRASMSGVLKEDYIKTAKAKGLSGIRVILIHALKNALIPVITIIGLMMGTLLGGAILTESTFSWPGIGKWLVNAVNQRDFPIIQGTTLIIAIIYVSINLITDILYAVVNPKIRLK
ncbi:ABC transporter permease [Campylobacter sp. MG1]|uniref:ABC transporter permease n=1 Tax=Campylobacter sp. MG1 TaxID=2976332 RepID=UPI00226CE276|nr:ABC transporter permease [Campylobacter sp. MG1]